MSRWVHVVHTRTDALLTFWCGRTGDETTGQTPSRTSAAGRYCPDCETAQRFATETDETAGDGGY